MPKNCPPLNYSHLDIGNASDLKGQPGFYLYRFFEILPGLLAWGTLMAVILLSWLTPKYIAFFVIIFALYWLLKTVYFILHLRSCFAHLKKNLKINWLAKSQALGPDWKNIYHLIILPTYKESAAVLSSSFEALVHSTWPKDKIIVVLTTEERAGQPAQLTAQKIEKKYGHLFGKFLRTTHPQDIAGELAGKGSNETWAAKQARKLIDELNLDYKKVLVSSLDIDTQIFPDYLARVAYHFLTAPDPYHTSYQPIPFYHNNIWDTPSFSRVVAAAGTFWHMIQQERPERSDTFSSHSMPFSTLVKVGFWNTKNVSEDSRIFWKCLMRFSGRYQVQPIFYPVSMDANLAPSWKQTAVNIYKQMRRWAWGSENIPYVLYGFLKTPRMPWRHKLTHAFFLIEGFWAWSTNALMLFFLGWLPIFLGGDRFNVSVLSYNLPRLMSNLMTVAMLGLVYLVITATLLMPGRPKHKKKRTWLWLIIEWLFFPVSTIFFGAIPALDAQTRLLMGKYMGFWVTPKPRITKQPQGESNPCYQDENLAS